MRLRFSLLHEHEELREHSDGFQVEGERPRDVRDQEVIQVRVQDERDRERWQHQPQVVQRVHVWIVGAPVLHAAAVDDGAREAEPEGLADLVEPVPRLVLRHVALEGHDGAEAAEEHEEVALHHLHRDSRDRLAVFDRHGHHQEAEHAHDRGQRQEEREVPARKDPEYGDHERREAPPQFEGLVLGIFLEDLPGIVVLEAVHPRGRPRPRLASSRAAPRRGKRSGEAGGGP
mmetsp:Transcript_97005/g.274739  ORF Transcript_97005/g.274739 Transcript_97005/m.274739 type:complete len:231 (-) Transcript_97005:2-694(-)